MGIYEAGEVWYNEENNCEENMSDEAPEKVGVGEGSSVTEKASARGGVLEGSGVFGHFLQSEDWEKYEQAEGRQVLREKGEGFRALLVVHETALGKYLFCPYGPELWKVEGHDLKWSLEQALNSLAELARREKAIFVRVEPTAAFSEAEMRELGLVKSHDLDPAHTWTLDLTVGQESLLSGMEKRKVRYWRNYAKRFTMRQTQDPEEIGLLTGLLAKLGERDHFNPQDEQHLKRQLMAGFATMYVLEVNDDATASQSTVSLSEANPPAEGRASDPAQPENSSNSSIASSVGPKVVAAALIYDYDGVRYYAHAAADEEYMRQAPGSIVLIQMILDASLAGMREYDFWGMTTSEDPKHPWYGFTQYKKSFGGRQVDYAGTWDLPVSRQKYRLYQGLRSVNRVMRKKR